jgi:hypothetical protein
MLIQVNWIEAFYNRTRIHSSIGYKTPVMLNPILGLLNEVVYVESRHGHFRVAQVETPIGRLYIQSVQKLLKSM